MKAKKYTTIFIITTLIVINIIAFINFIVDPYWTFKHSNSLNNRQIDFDERQQKTNFLYFVDNNFSNIMLGSSRTTFINQKKFNFNVFNYAANGMYPYEYTYFINTFKKLTKKTPTYIILGLDFFGTNATENKKYPKQNFLKNTLSSFYRYKLLYNYDIFHDTIKNLEQNIKITHAYYTRENIKFPKPIVNIEQNIKRTLKHIRNYNYDTNLTKYFSMIKQTFPKSNFIIFITPVSMKQLKTYRDDGLIKYYYIWLKDIVSVYNNIYNFMVIDKYTRNDKNFFDSNHMKPKLANLIAKKINGESINFGILLNKKNIDSFIKNFKNEIKTIK